MRPSRLKPFAGIRCGTLVRRTAVLWAAALLGMAVPLTAAQADDLPAMRFGEVGLLSPSTAQSYYDALPQTHTDGWGAERPAEILETARALRHDPAIIYHYVRDTIDYVPIYGLQKGAMGAIVDQSGTAFDQAHLMVELLRASGISARYRIGTITLTGAQVDTWLGITDRAALEKYLANGGIPAAVSGGATVSSATIGHAWVEAYVNGQWVTYDPSYKDYQWFDGIDLAQAMGYSRTGFISTAGQSMQTGVESGVSYVTKVNSTGIAAQMTTLATNLLNALRTTHKDKTLEEIAGGRRIVQTPPPTPGAPPPTIPYTLTGGLTVDDIPDVYRTRIDICVYAYAGNDPESQTWIDNCEGGSFTPPLFLKTAVFVDEIYGRPFWIDPDMYVQYDTAPAHAIRLTIGDPNSSGKKVLGTVYVRSGNEGIHDRKSFHMRLHVDHPYAAAEAGGASGSYMDADFDKSVSAVRPGIILHGWGETSPGLQDKFGETAIRQDRRLIPLHYLAPTGQEPGDQYLAKQSASGELTNSKMAASWLAQVDQFAKRLAGVRKLHVQHHHSIGVIYSYDILNPNYPDATAQTNQPTAWLIFDSKTVVDVRSGFSVTSRGGSAADEKLGRFALAGAAAALEGSVVEQFMDQAETVSTTERFEWANENVAGVRYYEFTPGTAQGTIEGVVTLDGYAWGAHPEFGPPSFEGPEFVQAVLDALTAGQKVVAPSEMHLGPGAERSMFTGHGWATQLAKYWSGGEAIIFPQSDAGRWRGPALIAHDPAAGSISHLVLSTEGVSKGGGSAEVEENEEFDPLKAADILKDEFEDRSVYQGIDLQTGDITYSAPADITVGSGEFPYALSFQRTFKAGETRSPGLPFGWTHNWDIRASTSGSGIEAMGVSSPLNAAATLAAILVTTDLIGDGDTLPNIVFTQMVNHWWLKYLTFNVVTIHQGHGAQQFVRLPDGSFNPPRGVVATLAMANPNAPPGEGRVACRTSPLGLIEGDVSVLVWKYDGLSFTLASGAGDVQTFQQVWHFPEDYDDAPLASNGCFSTSQPIPAYVIDTWTFPNGVTLGFDYVDAASLGRPPNLASVSNNLGRQLTITSPTGCCIYPGFTLNGLQVMGAISSVADGAGRSASFTYGADTMEATAPDGAVSKYLFGKPVQDARPSFYKRLLEVYAPSDPNTPVMKVDYDKLWRVKRFQDARATGFTSDNTAPAEEPPPVNSPPNAISDSFSNLSHGGTQLLNVVANDTDPDGDELTLASVGGAAGIGLVSIFDQTRVKLVVTTNCNVEGGSFNYTISDGNGGTDTATVSVSIDPSSGGCTPN